MKCAVHSEADSIYFCRTCGKAMCIACCHLIQGQAFCEACLARNVSGSAHAADLSAHPWLAFGLGWIPGVGAVVNGEYTKAAIHVAIFAGTIALLAGAHLPSGGEAFLGIFLGIFCIYMPFEAYQSARRKQRAAAGLPVTSQPSMTEPEFYRDFWCDWKVNAPIAGIVLVIIGVLLLLDNMGVLYLGSVFRLWPLLLILFGVLMLRSRISPRR